MSSVLFSDAWITIFILDGIIILFLAIIFYRGYKKSKKREIEERIRNKR